MIVSTPRQAVADRRLVGDIDAPVVDAFDWTLGRQIENDDVVATVLERAHYRGTYEAAAPCYQTNRHDLLDRAEDDVRQRRDGRIVA